MLDLRMALMIKLLLEQTQVQINKYKENRPLAH